MTDICSTAKPSIYHLNNPTSKNICESSYMIVILKSRRTINLTPTLMTLYFIYLCVLLSLSLCL